MTCCLFILVNPISMPELIYKGDHFLQEMMQSWINDSGEVFREDYEDADKCED